MVGSLYIRRGGGSLMDIVKGELSVAKFLVNYFSGVHFGTFVVMHPGPLVLQGTADPSGLIFTSIHHFMGL